MILEELLGDQELPGVVLVTAPHCAHCRSLAPTVARVAEEYEGRIQLVGVDAAESPDQARALKVRGTPTLIAARHGAIVARHVGAGGTAEVEGIFAAAAGDAAPAGIGATNRRLRTAAGVAVLLMAWLAGNWLLAAVGVAFVVAGWYDIVVGRSTRID